jgi:hypothetical protein
MSQRHIPKPVHTQDCIFLHAHGPDFSSIGWIREIGPDGVVYEYCVTDGKGDPDLVEVDIFRRDCNFLVSGISCRILFDVVMETPYFSRILTKRCGLQFIRLTECQRNELQAFFKALPCLLSQQIVFQS